MNDDITVDLGTVPLEHAKTLLLCVENCLGYGHLWESANNKRAYSLKAMLTYRIAKAERECGNRVADITLEDVL